MNISLSKRASCIQASPTLAITAKAKQMIADGQDVISFSAGEPDFDTPDHIKKAAIQAIQDGKTKYTAAAGINELRDAIVRKFRRDNKLEYTGDEVIVSAGGKHSLYNACQALLEEGDEVIIPAPYWVSYPPQVMMNDATPVIVQTSEKNAFRITADELEKAITPKTKLFILNSPSNPTGSGYDAKSLEAIAEVLVKNKIICLSDEIYEKLIYDGFEHTSIASMSPEMKDLTITFNGVSKAFAMTGWRLGYAAGPKDIIQAMSKIQSQATSSINTPTQWAAVEALEGDQRFLTKWVGEFAKRRSYMVGRLNDMPKVSCVNPDGAFYAFPNISAYGKSEVLAQKLLEEALVAVVPGTAFGAEGFIRLSYATSMENVEKGLDRIEDFLKEIK